MARPTGNRKGCNDEILRNCRVIRSTTHHGGEHRSHLRADSPPTLNYSEMTQFSAVLRALCVYPFFRMKACLSHIRVSSPVFYEHLN